MKHTIIVHAIAYKHGQILNAEVLETKSFSFLGDARRAVHRAVESQCNTRRLVSKKWNKGLQGTHVGSQRSCEASFSDGVRTVYKTIYLTET